MTDVERALHDLEVEKVKLAATKLAGPWQSFKRSLTPTSLGKSFSDNLGAAVTAAGVAAAGAAGAHGFNAIKDRLLKGRAFKNMVEVHPELRKQDSKAVQRTFNTMYALNPQLARDPLVSGGFVRRSMMKADVDEGAGAYIDINTARDLQRGGVKNSPVMDAFLGAKPAPPVQQRGWQPATRDEAREHEAFKSGLRPSEYKPKSRSESLKIDRYKAQMRASKNPEIVNPPFKL